MKTRTVSVELVDNPGEKTTVKEDVELGSSTGSGTGNTSLRSLTNSSRTRDPDLVTWDGPDDPENPRNWPMKKRWLLTLAIASNCFGATMASSVIAPGIITLSRTFDVSITVATLALSLYVLGWALGPLIASPVSEIYGRRIVLIPTHFLFVAALCGAAVSNNIETLLICRFLAGIFSSPVTAVAAGFCYDLFAQNEVGPPIYVIILCSCLGPAIGPLAGGYMLQFFGWRWMMWFAAIVNGADLLIWVKFPETNASVLLKNKCAALQKKTGNKDLRSTDHGQTTAQVMKTAIFRPFQLLVLEPIVMFTTLFVSFIWGTMYLYFGAYPIVFGLDYKWNTGPVGAAMAGIGIGAVLSAGAAGWSNRLYVRLCEKHGNGGVYPEGRLPLAMVAVTVAPIGIFWFAWTANSDYHWLIPCASGLFFGFSMACTLISFVSYSSDCFPTISASALAANSVIRSLFAMTFPLFTPQMFEKLGTPWALTTLGFISLALAPIPFVFWKYGPAIRARSRFTPKYTD